MKRTILLGVCLLFVAIQLASCEFDYLKTVSIENKQSGEIIYLKRFARGLNYERNIITTDSRITTEKEIDQQKYQDNTGSTFFYKLSNDTLYIYGGQWNVTDIEGFKTTVLIKGLSVPEYFELTKNYEDRGLEVFPPEHKEIIKR